MSSPDAFVASRERQSTCTQSPSLVSQSAIDTRGRQKVSHSSLCFSLFFSLFPLSSSSSPLSFLPSLFQFFPSLPKRSVSPSVFPIFPSLSFLISPSAPLPFYFNPKRSVFYSLSFYTLLFLIYLFLPLLLSLPLLPSSLPPSFPPGLTHPPLSPDLSAPRRR